MLGLVLIGAVLGVVAIAWLAWKVRAVATLSRPVSEKQARENAAPLTTAILNRPLRDRQW
jgi:hypothetical protein